MDEVGMLDFIERLWKTFFIGRGQTYMLMDVFAGHMIRKVLRAFEECGTVVDFIIAGYSS